jgi:hypothetical protein
MNVPLPGKPSLLPARMPALPIARRDAIQKTAPYCSAGFQPASAQIKKNLWIRNTPLLPARMPALVRS